MANGPLSDTELLRQLNAHPEVRNRIESILSVVGNESGDITVEEPQFRVGSKRLRPFAQSAHLRHRSCSLPLQRVVTDFGADVSFAQAMDKLVEHYGVLLAESTIRQITEAHAQGMFKAHKVNQTWPQQPGVAVVIAQMDGGMVPIVEPDLSQADQRKGKKLFWKEAKICLAHPQGSSTPVYGGTLQGDATLAGQQLFHCATQAGFGNRTHLHAVGDGADWIAGQVEDQFGASSTYLVDFYHVCEYLSAAAGAITTDATAAAWMDVQVKRLKTGDVGEVVEALQKHLEAPDVADDDAVVRRCHRYLSNRLDQLDYQAAISNDLPIGSGEIESAHRYVVQKRLKCAGTWWRAANAENMLALRLNRANRQWNDYWTEEFRAAA